MNCQLANDIILDCQLADIDSRSGVIRTCFICCDAIKRKSINNRLFITSHVFKCVSRVFRENWF